MPDIKPMSAEQVINFIKRVTDDLEAADGFVGITKEQILELKLKEALASYTKFLLENMPEDPEAGCKPTGYCAVCGYQYHECECKGINRCRSLLQDQIDQLTK